VAPGKRLCELEQSGLVGNGEEGAADGDEAHGGQLTKEDS
jgi:hypothetical protein